MADKKTVIEGSNVLASQIGELFAQIARGVLNGGHIQALLEHRNPFDGKGGGEKFFDPNTYFKDRKDLWVLDSFTYRILPNFSPMPYRGLEGVTSKDLPRNMCDKEIVDWFLGGMEEVCEHSFSLDQIATMIDLQPNGKDGDLLNNGRVNIFYVLVGSVLFAVHVDWRLDNRSWYVDGLRFGENSGWVDSRRVFCNTMVR
ncbi:MAG: hypothetical protein HY228_02985 [Candidatus Yonathbacteria bacterium]|nr:hypothetical protein [Candidatus Yonathbacteria bacterium]